ncbi:MAG: chemotaxis protein CheB, partial [Pseudomonadota bacterium]
DFIAKPAGGAGMRPFGEALRRKVRDASTARVRQRAAPAPAGPRGDVAQAGGAKRSALIAIGASTGGVGAIGSIVERLPKGLPPITCVVHMPEKYTGRFAQRLANQTGHDVAEARDGERLAAGMIRIAPGDRHLEVARAGDGLQTRLNDGDLVSGHKPSVDVCFASVAQTVGARAVGVILTGMGRDGAAGLLKMRQAGAVCFGEAASSCVVYGMPKAAKEMGAVNEEQDLEKIPERICQIATGATVRV